MRHASSAGVVILVVWLLIGTAAAGQRGYFDRADANCSTVGSTLITLVAGPLNYTGVNPKMDCETPQPSH